jgi:choice-of-anchor B domain-containing protein
MRRILACLLLSAAANAFASDDTRGTRYVDAQGVDEGECGDRHDPCRTLTYALRYAELGDSVKLAAGTYDLSGLDLEATLFGKQGLRGGFSTDDEFAASDPDSHPTFVTGADPRFITNLYAHGFTPIDASGTPIARPVQKAQPPANCVSGRAGNFPCWNVDYLAQIPLTSFASQPASASNLWGYVDRDDNREYVVIGLRNGTSIVEVTDPANPRQVTTIAGISSPWREVKTYQVFDPVLNRHRAYAYVSSEGPGAGLQVIDLTDLPASATLATTLTDISTSHTLYVSNVDYATGVALSGAQAFLYVAGSNLGNGRYRLYSLANPAQPALVTTSPGRAGDADPYMHDSASVLITDNRTTQCALAHNPCEVLIDFNVLSVDLWDVTDKSAPVFLGASSFPNARYIHSGWPTADQRHVIVHDELDELRIAGLRTSIYTLDIGDLRTPTFTTSYTGPDTTTDHNGYTIGNRYYLAHYRRGLVIFDIADPRALREVAYFDTFLTPSANAAGTDGVWGVYPFLPSGTIAVSDIENGLFLLKRNETTTTPPPTGGGGGGIGGGSSGGGGSLGVLAALLLGALVAARTRWRAPARVRALSAPGRRPSLPVAPRA